MVHIWFLSLNPYSNGLPSRGYYAEGIFPSGQVLIPILMDYPLGATVHRRKWRRATRLNPYSNGLPSRGVAPEQGRSIYGRLNPYSNGLPSRGQPDTGPGKGRPVVLIPILMDYPLGGKALKTGHPEIYKS